MLYKMVLITSCSQSVRLCHKWWSIIPLQSKTQNDILVQRHRCKTLDTTLYHSSWDNHQPSYLDNVHNYDIFIPHCLWWMCYDNLALTKVTLTGQNKPNYQTLGRNTPAQPLDIWSVWGDSDEVGNKYVWCVQLRWKLSQLLGRCLLRFSMQSLRRWAVRRLSYWILWLAVC